MKLPPERSKFRNRRTGIVMTVQVTGRTTFRMLQPVGVISSFAAWTPFMSFDTQDPEESFTSRFEPVEEPVS